MENNSIFIISLILLAYPMFTLPSIVKSKQKNGKFFTDKRFFISKQEGNGNSFNTKNVFGFFTTLILGLFLLVISLI